MARDHASAKHRFQAVADWLRRSSATCKEDYTLDSRADASERHRHTARATSRGRVPRDCRVVWSRTRRSRVEVSQGPRALRVMRRGRCTTLNLIDESPGSRDRGRAFDPESAGYPRCGAADRAARQTCIRARRYPAEANRRGTFSYSADGVACGRPSHRGERGFGVPRPEIQRYLRLLDRDELCLPGR